MCNALRRSLSSVENSSSGRQHPPATDIEGVVWRLIISSSPCPKFIDPGSGTGCHDNGYVTTLRSLMTAGFHDKLILLRGYSEMAVGIDELALPSFIVPDLFRPQKIVTTSCAPIEYGPFKGMALGSPPGFGDAKSSGVGVTASPTPGTTGNMKGTGMTLSSMRRPSIASSYSSVVQSGPPSFNRPFTPELDSSDSSSLSSVSDGPITVDSRSSSPVARMRHVNPNIVESILHLMSHHSSDTLVAATFEA